MTNQFENELIEIVTGNPWLMDVLKTVRRAGLPDCCVGAGAIRSVVWDHLHGFRERSDVPDVDVVYFDPGDTSEEREDAIAAELSAAMPEVVFDVKNQAGVHLWYEKAFGYAVDPVATIEEGIATWPETATCVGIRLEPDNTLSVIAPLGLDDLFHMIVRRNPRRVTGEAYRQRCSRKDYTRRWPNVTVIDES